MISSLSKNATQKITRLWDGKNFMERLYLIMDHMDVFWSLGLVTSSEMEVAEALSEGSREYIVSREDQPIFTSLQIKKNLEEQPHKEKMKAALSAVFFAPSKLVV